MGFGEPGIVWSLRAPSVVGDVRHTLPLYCVADVVGCMSYVVTGLSLTRLTYSDRPAGMRYYRPPPGGGRGRSEANCELARAILKVRPKGRADDTKTRDSPEWQRATRVVPSPRR